MAELKSKILLRNDTTANWTANKTVVLSKGEVGIAFDGTKPKLKIGTGVLSDTWESLPYFNTAQLGEGLPNYPDHDKEPLGTLYIDKNTAQHIMEDKLSKLYAKLGKFHGEGGSGVTVKWTEIALLDDQGKIPTEYLPTSTVADISGKEDKSNKITAWGADPTDAQYPSAKLTKNYIDTKISSTYQAKGSITGEQLLAITPSTLNEGFVYNITTSFETTNDFVEGFGKTHVAGENVVIIKISEDVYKFDTLSGFIDLSGYVEKDGTKVLSDNNFTTELKSQITSNQTDINTLFEADANFIERVEYNATNNSLEFYRINTTQEVSLPDAVDISNKADKAIPSEVGNIPKLDIEGNLVDSGFKLLKTVPANAVFTDTHYTSENIFGIAAGTENSATTNGNTYLNHIEEGVIRSSHKIMGTGVASVTSDTSGVIRINVPTPTATPEATSAVLGTVRLGSDTIQTASAVAVSTTNLRTYSIQKDNGTNGKLVVNVPWTDTKDTTGTTNNTDKLFLVGAKTQTGSSAQTYSNLNVYTTDGSLYANDFLVKRNTVYKSVIADLDEVIMNGGNAAGTWS